MKRAAPLTLALLFCVLTLNAQNGAQSKPQTMIVITLPTVEACPVGMQARQRGSGSLLAVDRSQRTVNLAQRINLRLTAGHSRQIRSATVIARGLTAKCRIIPAMSNQGDTPDISRTLNLRFSPGSEISVSADFLLAGFTSVSSIELESVTYSDGSTWKFSGHDGCHVTPDPLVLIDGQ